jgi:hypothetical protein
MVLEYSFQYYPFTYTLFFRSGVLTLHLSLQTVFLEHYSLVHRLIVFSELLPYKYLAQNTDYEALR